MYIYTYIVPIPCWMYIPLYIEVFINIGTSAWAYVRPERGNFVNRERNTCGCLRILTWEIIILGRKKCLCTERQSQNVFIIDGTDEKR